MGIGSALLVGGITLQAIKMSDRYDEDEIMMDTAHKRQWNDLRYVHEILALLVAYVYAHDKGENIEIQLDSLGYELHSDPRIPFAHSQDLRLMVFRRVGQGPNGREALLRVEDDDNSGQDPVRWPEYIVAIRGTVIWKPEDLRDDLIIAAELMWNQNFITPLVKLLSDLYQEAPGPDGVWIAGHSLGAFIGLVATVRLAMQGIVLNPHLFNSPNISLGVLAEKLFKGTWNGVADGAKGIPGVGRILGPGIRGTCSLGVKAVKQTAGIAIKVFAPRTSKEAAQRQETLLDLGYRPHMYVNPKDFVCNAYYEHFHRGSPAVSSALPFVKRFVSRDAHDCYLIPQAYLHTNHRFKGPWHAHKLDQWWLYEPVNFESKIVGRLTF